MSSGATGYDSKTYEHIKYWYDTQAWLPKNAVLVNKKAFDSLDKPTQDAVIKVAQRRRSARLENLRRKERVVQESPGRKRHENSQAFGQAAPDFKQVGAIMLEDWLKKAGPEGKAIVDAYRK